MKQFCLRGHDTFVVGRRASGNCRECSRAADRIRIKTARVKVMRRAENRRFYQRHQARIRLRLDAWKRANPEKQVQYARRSRLKYKGVNFWVEAAKESV